MKGYRTATHLDYKRIHQLLVGGGADKVLVRSLFRPENSPYPLSEISIGEYQLTDEGISGFSKDGEKCVIRITSNPLHYVELKRGTADWMAPEWSSVILLIPE